MKPLSRLALALGAPALLAAPAAAQVPDLLNALDAGGRAMAMGGATNVTNVDTLSAYYNPAALAYLDTRAVDLVYRNLPDSRTHLGGSLSNQTEDTDGRHGGDTISHAGFAVPLRTLLGKGSGTLAVAYTLGGYVNDRATANSLSDGALTAQDYRLNREARTSFYSLSYGKAINNALSLGVGLVGASTEVRYSESYTETIGQNAFPTDISHHDTNGGVGVLVGALYTPTSLPAVTFGLSYRSPMSLSGDNGSDGYDRIPSRIIFGASYRKEGFREGKDYLLLGGQVESFFGGDSSRFFDRDNQTVFGFGAEYNVGTALGRVPVRFGFATVPRGGDGYESRDAFTLGIGVRPNRFPVGLDFSYAIPENGGHDFSIAASYRFK